MANLRSVASEEAGKISLTETQRRELDRILTAIAEDLEMSKDGMMQDVARRVG
jgi:hypothetical protein